jgi:putative membrane protein
VIVAHGVNGSPGAWDFDPIVLTLALATVLAYARGVNLLQKRRSARLPSWTNQALFYLGVFVATAAVASPLHGWSETLFAAHMSQHLLLMIVAAPLIVLGRPSAPMIAALPGALGKQVSRVIAGIRRRAPLLLHPVSIWALNTFVLWAWHVPALYDLALENTFVHGLEHATFLGSSLLLWGAVVGERPIGEGPSVLLLFATGLQSAALGALLALATTVLYSTHVVAAPTAGVNPLADQQLAGVIMWIPPGILYLSISAVLLSRMLQDNTRPPLGEAGRS